MCLFLSYHILEQKMQYPIDTVNYGIGDTGAVQGAFGWSCATTEALGRHYVFRGPNSPIDPMILSFFPIAGCFVSRNHNLSITDLIPLLFAQI